MKNLQVEIVFSDHDLNWTNTFTMSFERGTRKEMRKAALNAFREEWGYCLIESIKVRRPL